MQNFRPSEFQCLCDYDCGLGFADVDQDALERLEMARLLSGVKYRLRSAVRCERHNRDVNGTEGSAHVANRQTNIKSKAFDIETPNSQMRFRVLYGLIKAGFNRIGVYASFIHADTDETKPQAVLWFSD